MPAANIPVAIVTTVDSFPVSMVTGRKGWKPFHEVLNICYSRNVTLAVTMLKVESDIHLYLGPEISVPSH
jgi:hypothetical protein